MSSAHRPQVLVQRQVLEVEGLRHSGILQKLQEVLQKHGSRRRSENRGQCMMHHSTQSITRLLIIIPNEHVGRCRAQSPQLSRFGAVESTCFTHTHAHYGRVESLRKHFRGCSCSCCGTVKGLDESPLRLEVGQDGRLIGDHELLNELLAICLYK